MKNFTLSVILAAMLIGSGAMQAKDVSESEALQVAQQFRREAGVRFASAPLKMVHSQAMAQGTAYYVFAPENGRGFTVVSGNDAAAPVLMYDDHATFDPGNIPPGMQHMLAYYAERIEYAAKAGLPAYRETPRSITKQNIEPICKTTWDQDAPYWNLCPTRYGSRCYTGCVATAMAQAVYVYKYPEKSKGTATWNGSTVSFNRTYAWDQMLLDYSGSYTTAQGTAVAELMVDLGKSVDMSYSTSGSGAETSDVPSALVDNFSYDKAVAYTQADQYAESDWNDLMYYQLSQGWPVIYGGFGTGYNGGHQFICDGYRYNAGDWFHINWGWGGLSDTYCRLTVLEPGQQGAGGNTSNFSTGCDAVYYVRPPMEGSQMQTMVSCRGNFVMGTAIPSSVKFQVTNGKIWTTNCNGFINLGGFNFNATLGVRLINADDPSKTYTLPSKTGKTTLRSWSIIVSNFTVDMTSVAPGKYYVFPYSLAEGKTEWERVTAPRNMQQYVVLNIDASGNITSTTPTAPQYVPVNTLIMADNDSVTKGDILRLNPVVIPSNGTNPALRYSTSDPNIATVDSITGVVTGLHHGTCRITATTTDGSQLSATTTVKVLPVGGVSDIQTDSDEPCDVYTVTGILVARGVRPSEIGILPAGIYIAGGRKYMVR